MNKNEDRIRRNLVKFGEFLDGCSHNDNVNIIHQAFNMMFEEDFPEEGNGIGDDG